MKKINILAFAITLSILIASSISCKDKADQLLTDEVVSSEAASIAEIPEQISFNYHIRPILSDRCFKCHGPDKAKIEAGLSLHTREAAILALGDAQDHYAIVPNDIENSTLIDRIYTDDVATIMPPPESNLTLNDYEKELLKKWVAQGAEYEQHWSFNEIDNSNPPSTKSGYTAHNPIDIYVADKLATLGIAQAPKADKERLIRRVAFDLTGLPPIIEEIENYLADDSPSAYESMVDHYLESQGYAENMTTMWLDVARYADTHGYQDDLERVMWPWRDWVLHAFEKNMPYDQFVEWQLAGDLLPSATKEQIIATGFNRNHKITQEGGVIPEEYLAEYVSDRTLTFGKAFLGLSVECAKCHDHKYDPISQKEYYSLFAFFNNVPEKGLIEEYGATPEPYMTLTAEEIESQLSFIKNIDTLPKIELMVMGDQKIKRKTHILARGAYDQPREEVEAGVPSSVLSFDGFSKDRVGLSKWLFDQRNPLTARVMVNRLWAMCYGKGLVGSLDDFGAQGSLPSYPKLLDHLASKFMNEGWDMKAMLKYMVMSYTYQQSSKVTSEMLEVDPNNDLLALGSRSRLSAEKIRDHALASSGLLVKTIGGPSVRPYQPEGLWKEFIGGGADKSTGEYVIDKGEKQYRRSLYTFWKRTVPPPDMLTFDAVTRDFCMVSRETTSTPLQALVMMNSPQIIESARNLAYQGLGHSDDVSERISFMFRAATSRMPTADELSKMVDYLDTEIDKFNDAPEDADAYLAIGDSPQRELLTKPELAAYAMVANAIFNLDESITRS